MTRKSFEVNDKVKLQKVTIKSGYDEDLSKKMVEIVLKEIVGTIEHIRDSGYRRYIVNFGVFEYPEEYSEEELQMI